MFRTSQKILRYILNMTLTGQKELLIIGMCGDISSGKDTVANILVREHGFKRVAFADKLKEACKIIYNFSDEQVYGTQPQKEAVDPYWGSSPRSLMQQTGTNAIRRVIGRDVWVMSLMQTLLRSNGGRFVISDCRFKNEMDMVRSLGGEVWNVERRKLTATEQFMNKVKDFLGMTHESERLWHNKELADRVIDNTQGLMELEVNVNRAMTSMIYDKNPF